MSGRFVVCKMSAARNRELKMLLEGKGQLGGLTLCINFLDGFEVCRYL